MARLRSLSRQSVQGGVQAWLVRQEAGVLVAMLAVAAGLLAFAKLAEEVVEGDTHAFDEFLLLSLRNATDPSDPVGPRWLEEMMRDFTALGGTGILAAVTLAVIGFLTLTRKHHAAITVALAVVTGLLLSQALKWGFSRPRPELVPHGQAVYTQSFPSGHAMLSAVVYLTLGALLARTEVRRSVRVYFLTVAVLITVIVGVSRVYLGVHWPTDVLAGWAGGAGWALLCWLVMLWLQRRGKVEVEGVPAEKAKPW